MDHNKASWVEELFLILDIAATKQEWQRKVEETLHSLKNEVQFMVSTLNNNENQLIQEAQKRVTGFYINGSRTNLTMDIRVIASEMLLRNQQPELALTVLQPIEMDGSSEYLINFGRALMQIGILDQAKQCFMNACEKNPESPEPFFHLAFCSSVSGDTKSAVGFYKESLEKDPKHIGSLMNLAYLYYQLEQFEPAIEYARQVIATDKHNPGGYLTMCACLNATKRFVDSASYIEKARKLCGDNILELDELECVICYELKQYQRAVELVTRYLTTYPKAIDLRYIRGNSNIQLKNWNDALLDMDELLSLEPFDTQTLESKFIVLYQAKRWQEAEIAYIKLLENAPHLRVQYTKEYTEIRTNLAIVIG